VLCNCVKNLSFYDNYKGWTQEDVADKLELSPTGYGDIERGDCDISFTRLVRIAHIYDMDVTELVGLDERNVFHFNNNTGCQNGYIVSSIDKEKELQHQLEKSMLVQQALQNEVESLKKQIVQLEEINRLLKQSPEKQKKPKSPTPSPASTATKG